MDFRESTIVAKTFFAPSSYLSSSGCRRASHHFFLRAICCWRRRSAFASPAAPRRRRAAPCTSVRALLLPAAGSQRITPADRKTRTTNFHSSGPAQNSIDISEHHDGTTTAALHRIHSSSSAHAASSSTDEYPPPLAALLAALPNRRPSGLRVWRQRLGQSPIATERRWDDRVQLKGARFCTEGEPTHLSSSSSIMSV